MTETDVFCYGELGVDSIIRVPYLPTPEQAAFPTMESDHVGGAAANTAVWLASWGLRVALAGNVVGPDERGGFLLEQLGRHPTLDLSHLEVREGSATPFCRILVTPDGERSILVFWYPTTPKTPLEARMLGGARFVALDLYGGEERLEAARTARRAGARTVIGDVVTADHPILPFTDVATNSAAYVRERFPGIDVLEHSRRLQAASGGIVISTDGSRPVHIVTADGSTCRVEPPQVRAVDTTGAGDAFRAGLIYGLVRGWSLEASACWAAAAGALKVQRFGGGSDVPARDEVAALAQTVRVVPGV